MEYGTDHAELYDLVFQSRGKDYEAEAEGLISLIRSRFPASASLLDVACGTGAHVATFAKHFDHVEGLEYSPAMRRVAQKAVPGVTVHQGDMRAFDLGRKFDAVTCMGNAVAEVDSPDQLPVSIEHMAAHLVPGGVLVVEPWYFPDNLIDGYVGGHTLQENGRVISRMTHTVRRGLKSRMEVRFIIADASGFHDFSEVLWNNLFTREQYESALRDCGLETEFVPGFALANGRPNGPGLFVGVRR